MVNQSLLQEHEFFNWNFRVLEVNFWIPANSCMDSCHFSVCCSWYHSLFKKSKFSWNCEVLIENELSVWDPCEISLRPCAHVWGIASKPGVLFDWPYLSRGKSDLDKFSIKKLLMTSAFECAMNSWDRIILSKVIPFLLKRTFIFPQPNQYEKREELVSKILLQIG